VTRERGRAGIITFKKTGEAMANLRNVILLGLAVACPASAADWKMSCPPQLATAQSVVGALPAGWAAVARTESAVTDTQPGATVGGPTPPISVSVFDGPPTEMADLVPDNPNARVVRWTFDKKRTRDVYVVCNYADTRMALAQKAPAEITSCTLANDQPGLICR